MLLWGRKILLDEVVLRKKKLKLKFWNQKKKLHYIWAITIINSICDTEL